MNIHKRDLRRWRKAIVSYVLVAALVLGLIPQSAYAAETEAAEKTYTSEGFTITYKESSAWGNYVNAEVTLKNETDCAKSLWKVTFDYEGEIDSVWNADIISSENGTYVLSAKTYNSTIGAGQSVSFGFMAHGTEGKPSIPESIAFADTAGLDDSGESGDDSGETGVVMPAEWAGLNYAMFTSGETGLSFYTGTMQVTGSVHTNQDFYYQGGSITIDGTLEAGKSITLKTSDGADAQKIGAKREKAETIEMPDITKEVSGYVKENGTVYESALDLGSDPVIIDTPVYTGGELTLHATSFLGQGIVYAKDSITVNAGELITPEESRIFLASESGDITLNGSNMSLNAVLYAPNGCVYINTGEFRLNGRIIAKQIVFNGTGLYVEASPDDLDLISFIMPEDMVVPGIKTDACYVRDENGEAHISIENLAQITNETKISEIQYVIYHDANRNDDFSEDECVDIISSREESVPVVLTGVGNYKVVQQILMTDGSVVATEDQQSAYFEIVNQKPATGLKIEKEAKADILMLYNGLDAAGKEGYQALKEALEKAGEENGVSLSVTQEEIASVHEDFNWISFDHVDYDSHGPHIAVKEDGFAFTSYEKDPLKDFVFTETGMGCDQVISFTLQQEQTEATEGCGMIFGASVESTENPECYRNHTYKVIDTNNIWEDAEKDCESQGGYLATITSEWEKDYIEEHVLPEKRSFGYWLGGRRDEKDVSLWKWVTGEDFYWTRWDGGEPNNLGGGEDYLMLYGSRKSRWNDTVRAIKFPTLCEWDGPHMSGYTVLLTDEGMKLIALEDVDMDNVRNGSYARLENAGTLLGTFPYDMKTREHNITIERNDNVVTITDNDEVIVEDFALDVTLKGTGIAPIVSYSRQSQAQEMKECASIGQIKVKELTSRVVQDAVKNHKWEDGAVRYVIHASEAETEEYQSDEFTASLIQYLLENQIHFIGMGQANVMAFTRLDAAVDGTMAQSGDEVSDYMNQSLKEIDREAGGYLTTKDSLVCEAEYRDAEKDPLYRQEWTYDYREGVLSEKEQGEEEQIVTEEPITRFDRCGAYHIGLRVQDNPVGENEALSDYRLWSEKIAWDKTLYVHHIPEAAVTAKKEMEENCCHITLSGSGSDEDHRDEEEKGIIKEYYSYKELDDTRWTEGKIPDTVECGKYYLVKYEVEDKEHAKSAPAVACIDTSARRVMDASKDTEAPKAVLHVSSKTALINDVVQITAYATDNYGVKEFALYIDGKKVLSRSGTLQYSCYEEGTVEIIAEAEDFNKNKTVEKAQITVRKEGGTETDEECPEIHVDNIHFNEDKTLIEIEGTITDNEAIGLYRVSYVDGDGQEIVIGQGSEQISENQVIAQLETESLANGAYDITILAEDSTGNQTMCYFTVTYNASMEEITYEEQDTPPEDPDENHFSDDEIIRLQDAKQNAITWLKAQADENGSWSKDGLMNTTCDVLAVLQSVDETMDSPAYHSWAEAKGETMNVDEQCHALMANPDATAKNKLWEQQNADGGFGLTDTYTSDLYDTLLVLRTEIYMQELGFASVDSGRLTNALSYIVTNRNADGGFGYHGKDVSRVELTAEYAVMLGKLQLSTTDDSSLTDFCTEQYTGDFSEEQFAGQAMLARVKQQLQHTAYSKEIMDELLAVQKENGSIYENVEDTMLYIVLLDEMIKEGE